MNGTLPLQFAWVIAAIGWMVALIAIVKAWGYWRGQGVWAYRYNETRKRCDQLIAERAARTVRERNDTGAEGTPVPAIDNDWE